MYAVYGVLQTVPADRPVLLLIDNLACCKIIDEILLSGSEPRGVFDKAEADIVLCICNILERHPAKIGRALWIKAHCELDGNETVSYTHLTLPTICSV